MKFEIIGLNGKFDYELQTVAQVFFPNDNFEKFERCILGDVTEHEINIACHSSGDDINISIRRGTQTLAQASSPAEKTALKLNLYGALKCITQHKPPWGSLTGIRPSKRVLDWLLQDKTHAEALELLTGVFDVEPAKAQLALDVAIAELPFVSNPDSYSLYIGIPFCPTKCLYCSFTSYPIKKYGSLVGTYLDCLEKELAHISRNAANLGKLQSVYIGGGTPSSLSQPEIARLLYMVTRLFDTSNIAEFSFEAGRADTITLEKLETIKQFGVNRICVNPQSLNDTTLQNIGRNHNSKQFVEAFEMARSVGFHTINTDIILGLDNETISDVEQTLDRLAALAPENITVHTLALKRGSRLSESDFNPDDAAAANNIEAMISLSAQRIANMGLSPYYMYRQKNSLGNFENVGYSKPGHESIYNIQTMAEKQTIVAAGAGAVTKIYNPATDNLRRIFNVKYVGDYITRIDEMISRKADLR